MVKILILLFAVQANAAKTVTLTTDQLANMLRNRDCSAACKNVGDSFGWWSASLKKCGCGRWEEPKELMEPKLYLSFQKTYTPGVFSSDIGREDTPWTPEPYSSYEPARMDTLLKSLQWMVK